MPKIEKNLNKNQRFKKKTGIFIKVLVPLLFLGLPVIIVSYSNLIAKILSPYISDEILQETPLFFEDVEIQTRLILIFTLFLAIFLGILIARHFSKLLLKISGGLRKILAGDLNFKIKIEGRDEIGEITYLLNKMAEYLKESKIALSEREKDLKEKSLELSEKINILELSGQEAEKARLATLNILEDVEEAREELEKEKERIENIVLSLSDGLLVIHNHKILLLNPSAEDVLKIKAKNIVGKLFAPFPKNKNLKILFEFLEKNKKRPIVRREIIFQEPKRDFQITAILIGLGQDLVILHNITREKLIEQMKTEFVSLAAHQLRTPISAIKWTIRMILDGDLGKITKEQRELLQKTYISNERMIGLINDLLNVARIEEGRYLHKPSLQNIESIVQSLVNSYKEEAKRRKISLIFNKPKEKISKLKLDVEKINSAIQNLIDNAVRYTPAGGVVTVSLKGGKKEVECSVKDSGVGIPESQQERVFGKFFRGANVMRMETEGSGLGLFITKNIIEAHGGKVWFKSKEGQGATFYITLPVPG